MAFDPTKGTIVSATSSGGGFDPSKGVVAPKEQTLSDKIWSGLTGVGKAIASNEIGFGKDIASAITANSQVDQATASAEADNKYIQTVLDLKKKAQAAGKDTSHWDELIKNYKPEGFQMPDLPTTSQVLGHAAGTALDIVSAGSYGKATSGAGFLDNAVSGQLTKAAPKVLGAVQATKPLLGETLKTIGVKTAQRAAVGGATGYGYDVSQNLQNNEQGANILKPGWGTALGVAIPTAIGGIQAGVAITKDTAPRFINSLIKPSQANFSYGKDPGRTVSEMGITGNSLPDFQKNIYAAKDDVGSKIGAVYDNPSNATKIIDATPEIAKIDEAITQAAKGGKSNQGIVTALQNTKDALLYEHAVNADGVIEKVGEIPRDLSKLSPKEAFELKDLIAQQTKFTGSPSDDKAVNSVLKSMYGGLKDSVNTAVSGNNPEITRLNQQYADLTSAVLAVQHRDAIISRANIISTPIKIGTAAAFITAVSTGGAAIPALLAGASAAVLDKALESTAVKTRIASWLGSESPSVVSRVLQQNPGIKTVLYRALPKFSSQLGQTEQGVRTQ